MKQVFSKYQSAFLFVFLFIGICVATPEVYNWTGDQAHFKNWSSYLFLHGLKNAYSSGTDYPPFFQFLLMIYVWTQPTIEAVSQNIKQMKYIFLAFDFAAVMLVYQWMIDLKFPKEKALFLSMFILLNIAYLYNTVIFGQVDSTYIFFLFGAVYLAYNKQILPSLIFCLFAINSKFYAFIYFPLVFLMLFPEVIKQFSIKKILIWIVALAATQYLLLVPFYHNGHLPYIRYILFENSLNRVDNLSMDGYNMWYWVSDNPKYDSGATRFLGISYRKWGTSLFIVSYFLMILPLLLSTFNQMFSKVKWAKPQISHYLLIGTLIALVFFFFPTQMSNRYSVAAIIFAGANAVMFNKYRIYITVSAAYFLNNHNMLFHKFLNTGYFFYNPKFIAFLFLLAIILVFIDLYKDLIKWKKVNVQTSR